MDLAHRRFVAVLCILFKIKSNQMHSLSGALTLPYVPARVTRGALVACGHPIALHRCRTSQNRRTYVPRQSLFGKILVTLCLMVWDWRVLRTEPVLSSWPNQLFIFVSNNFLIFILPLVGCVGLGSSV